VALWAISNKPGKRQYTRNGKPFCIRNASDPKRPVAILPLRYLEEVKNAPQSQLSLPLFITKVPLSNRIHGDRRYSARVCEK